MNPGRRARRLLACGVLLVAAAVPAWTKGPASAAKVGEHIFRDGVLADGAPLRGHREGGPEVLGKDAACVNCHGRSGMGVVEGRIVIPPITAAALFHPGERLAPSAEHVHVLPTPPNRNAYTDETLARAIREGVNADGRTLDYAMPRYALDDASMQAVVAQLHQLSTGRTPGAVNDELNFATIITPDADPLARDAMLAVLREFFAQKNDFSRDDKAFITSGSVQRRFRVQRRWILHEWRLTGSPESWGRQLDQKLRTEPIFAVISGIGGANWAPVHEFCEHRAIPCLFPNVDLPVAAEGDFYPVYFSRGVLLEADLIAARLATREARPARVVQVFRKGDIGASAAIGLRSALEAGGVPVVDRALSPGDDDRALGSAAQTQAGDALVLWLRGNDLARLPPAAPAAASVLVSGLMGGEEAAPMPAAWREAMYMPYVYALPEERRVLLNFALGWFRARHIPVVNERVQVDTYIACSILAENLIATHGTFLRDFLVERVEAMIGTDMFRGNYKRLGLAPGQRFASKGGYFVRFTAPQGPAIAPDGNWMVP